MIVGRTSTRETSVYAIEARSGAGPGPESFEAVLNALVIAKASVTAAGAASVSSHLGGTSGVQDSMAMMGWRDRLPFGRKEGRPPTSDEPLDEIVRGAARALKDSLKDSRETQEALDRFIRDLLRGETPSEFSSLMNPVSQMASKVEHAVAGFGQTTGNYVANHAQEIGLSAGAAAVVGGLAAGAVDVVGGLGAVAAF